MRIPCITSFTRISCDYYLKVDRVVSFKEDGPLKHITLGRIVSESFS
jgi:hypothetical protein